MVTIYSLLEVSEDATNEEIERSFEKLVLKYQTNPNLSDEANKENEFILNKLKMAHDILINDEKRKKYDIELAKKRAENLIQNIPVQKEENETQTQEAIPKAAPKVEEVSKTQRYDEEFDDTEEIDDTDDTEEVQEGLSSEEKMRLRKAAKEEFNRKLKKAQEAEEEYNKAYNKAYNEYMKKAVKRGMPAPIKKFVNTLIVIVVTVIVAFIAWHIPPIKKIFVDLYNENKAVKFLADFVISTIKALFGKN